MEALNIVYPNEALDKTDIEKIEKSQENENPLFHLLLEKKDYKIL